VSTILLDTHVVHWWSAEPERVSPRARALLEEASELAVAAVSWYELAWLARHDRIVVNVPVRSWLSTLATQVRTIGVTPAIADAATALPSSFPRDPADRMIFATAVEHGLKLVSKDHAIRDHAHSGEVAVW
jgi:PIN domain nuclease of toxin-antitoxin system